MNSAGLSLADARACVWASSLAYGPIHEFETEGCHGVVHDLQIGEKITYLVAFRGTASIFDLASDARFWKRAHRHEGIYASYKPAKPKVYDALTKIPKDAQFLICGHSLGGAQARFAAMDFVPLFPNYSGLYTFGEPRSGDANLAKESNRILGDTHFRFVDQEDLVPRIPGVLPIPFVGGYRHSGREIFMPSEGGYCANPPLLKKLESDLNGIRMELRKGDLLPVLEDHHIKLYMDKINSL